MLELGCGVGRVTNALVERGLVVTAVDNSQDMLAHVQGANSVCSDIESLNLNKKFDAVMLGSFLINSPKETIRHDLLKTCRKHLKNDGVLFVECHPFALLETISIGDKGERNGVHTYIDSVERNGNTLSLQLRWEIDGETWTQSFETEILNGRKLQEGLERCDLKFVRWLDDSKSWLLANVEGAVNKSINGGNSFQCRRQ